MQTTSRVHLKGRPDYTGTITEVRDPDPRAQPGSPAAESWVCVTWDREDKTVAWSGYFPSARVVTLAR